MTIENVNVALLKAELEARAQESRALKRILGATWKEPMDEAQRALVRCRRRTTELCILRAYLRGRFHLARPLREGAYAGMTWDRERYHALVAARLAGEFSAAPASEARP
ncbi:MAG: hypothetical protein K8H88_07225 [Sandaracinaceae bacterium]|nr:hypothetical protein [Sandaracinaceae bacterium]